MLVTVKLFAYLREGRFKVRVLELADDHTVRQVLQDLSISEKEMKIGIIMINGKRASFESHLGDGDTLAIFPPLAGG
ncbi:MAG: MoaD/ThiS family protein [Syntrophomonadaceae bacterium]|nr:MoaD/ThiS family protein [Syntrophomonadaceae bacterium]